MGCDIHMHVEARLSPTKGREGYWHKVDQYYTVKTWKGELHVAQSWGDERNYNEFAILADVRNGRGFAGRKTGEGFIPICSPKGMPDDADDEVAAACRAYGSDGHSHSWLTLRELIGTPEYWDQTTKFEGDPDTYTYREVAPNIIGKIIPALKTLMGDYYFRQSHEGGELTEDDIRIVFWFDN